MKARPGKNLRQNRPFIFVNMAMTADGKIASANRAVSSFASPYDKHHLLVLRSRADAVMAGARTIDLNPVNMGPGPAKYRRMRIRQGFSEYNLRIVVSGRGTIDPGAAIFRKRFSPIIVLTTNQIKKARLSQLRASADEVKICGDDAIDFPEALSWLSKKWKVRHLLCEGGGELNAALISADLVDEIHLTICPKILGGAQAPTVCDGQGVQSLAEAKSWNLKSMRRRGEELFLTLTRPASARKLS